TNVDTPPSTSGTAQYCSGMKNSACWFLSCSGWLVAGSSRSSFQRLPSVHTAYAASSDTANESTRPGTSGQASVTPRVTSRGPRKRNTAAKPRPRQMMIMRSLLSLRRRDHDLLVRAVQLARAHRAIAARPQPIEQRRQRRDRPRIAELQREQAPARPLGEER